MLSFKTQTMKREQNTKMIPIQIFDKYHKTLDCTNYRIFLNQIISGFCLSYSKI